MPQARLRGTETVYEVIRCYEVVEPGTHGFTQEWAEVRDCKGQTGYWLRSQLVKPRKTKENA